MLQSLSEQIDYADVARFCSAAGKHTAAMEACVLGLGLLPGDPLLLVRCAEAHDGLGEYEQAIAAARAALDAKPAPAIAAAAGTALALALESSGAFAAAREAALAAVTAAPDDRAAHAVLGSLLAWHGELAAAWPELECHWLDERIALGRRFARPEWSGDDIAGRRVAVVHGQGLGDMIQMTRYLPRLRERGAHVTLECPPSLERLLRGAPGIDALAPRDSLTEDDFDVHVRLMSLPRLLGGELPSGAAHLRVPPRTNHGTALRVGLAWAGNPFHEFDRVRSLPLEMCAPWAQIPGIRWTSLQIGPRSDDASRSPLALERHDETIGDFADTAAIIAQLDLVISVDTAVAHLAGMLGAPVWLMLGPRGDWRWLRSSESTPWYPTMRMIRATKPAWDGVIVDVGRRLRALATTVTNICR